MNRNVSHVKKKSHAYTWTLKRNIRKKLLHV